MNAIAIKHLLSSSRHEITLAGTRLFTKMEHLDFVLESMPKVHYGREMDGAIQALGEEIDESASRNTRGGGDPTGIGPLSAHHHPH
jgi:hypothetical protein